jgi:hypothetical protein
MKLRLGPLPRAETVRITIAVPVALKSQLDRYAQVHSSVWNEPVEAAVLIPHMLSEFMSRDRGFKNALKRSGRETAGSPSES